MADMIDFMCKDKGADINKFHLIGHSLGAHTVGYAGMYVQSGRIPRITGLYFIRLCLPAYFYPFPFQIKIYWKCICKRKFEID